MSSSAKADNPVNGSIEVGLKINEYWMPAFAGMTGKGIAMPTAPKYFMYFPGNYRWSAAFVNMLGTAPFGGVDMSELHQIGRMLEGRSGDDDEAWFGACVHVADTVRGHADKFRATHPVSAASFYL